MKLFVRDLTVIDSSYLCEQRGLVGDSWIVDIELGGVLNEMNMLLDFGRVKKVIKAAIDRSVDHRLLVPLHSPLVRYQRLDDGMMTVDLLKPEATIHLRCPAEAFALIPAPAITIESVTAYLMELLRVELPETLDSLTITLRHEKLSGANYHYSHGLKRHDGNCQRIAHGHRSPLEIYLDGVRATDLEAQFATRWSDIYLANREDLVDVAALNLSEIAKEQLSNEHVGFCYRAPQGEFQIALPRAKVEILDQDTTVELLAEFIAHEIKALRPNQAVRVVAYEGVGKGAIATA